MNELEGIKKAVCEVFGITPDDLCKPCRERPLVEARECFCYVAFHKGYRVQDIAKMIYRNRTTVLHSLENASADLVWIKPFKDKVQRVQKITEDGTT